MNPRNSLRILLALGLVTGSMLSSSAPVHARGDLVPGSRFISGRGAALGDAFLPLADDGSALFYNPAGLGKIRKPHLEPLNFQVQGNHHYAHSMGLNVYKAFSLSSYAPVLAENPGETRGASAALFPNFSIRGLAFGMLMQSRVSAVHTGSRILYRSQYQLIPTVGGALRLASGVVRIGYSAQWVNQASGDMDVPATQDPLGYNQGLAQGSAISHNLGMAITMPVKYLPSLNVVGRNLFGTSYGSFSLVPLAKNTSGVPQDEPMTFDVSASIQPKLMRGSVLSLVLEMRDLTNRSGVSMMGRAAAGAEFSVRNTFFLRTGWGSGYPSAGFGLRQPRGEFALSWFSEEMGDSYRSARDIRYVLHYQMRAF